MKDLLGKEVKIGNVVIFATNNYRGRTPNVNFARVSKITATGATVSIYYAQREYKTPLKNFPSRAIVLDEHTLGQITQKIFKSEVHNGPCN